MSDIYNYISIYELPLSPQPYQPLSTTTKPSLTRQEFFHTFT